MSGAYNVVLIVLDTARADALAEIISDPNSTLGELARTGRRFTSATATAPWTLPSHASIFTGTYPSKHGAHAGHKRLSKDLPTLPEQFSEAGYRTVAVSNNTWVSEEFGFGRGFQQFLKTWQYVQSKTDLGRIARTEEGTGRLLRVASTVLREQSMTTLANAVYGRFFRKQEDSGAKRTNRMVESWLSDHREEPFFLFINYLEPHLAYDPPAEYARRHLPDGVTYQEAMAVPQDAWAYIAGKQTLSDEEFDVLRALYRAELAYLDDRIDELQRHLASASQLDNTIFVITGDHGENIGDHGLMDHQYCLYDTLLRVPLVASGGPFDGGIVDDRLVQLVDVAPTLLDVTEISAPDFISECQGRSFAPGTSAPRDCAVAEYMAPQPSMEALEERVGTLPEQVSKYDRSLRAVRTDREKLIRGSDGSVRYYRLDGDPDETNDRSNSYGTRVDALEQRLDGWLRSFDKHDLSGEDGVTIDGETKDRLEELGYL